MVYELLCRQMVVTASRAAQELELSAPTVRRVLKDMEASGMIREVTGKARGHVYVYQRLLDLLEDAV